MGGTTVIADTGTPPPVDVSTHAHAGCLSFEMSSGRQHFIVNAGVDTYRRATTSGRWRAPPPRIRPRRSTTPRRPASTIRARVNDIIGTPLIDGPRDVPCERSDQPGSAGLRRQP